MKRIFSGVVLGLVALAGCASLIDINDYEAPPADGGVADEAAVTDASEASVPTDATCGPAANVEMLAVAQYALHVAVDDTNAYYTYANPSNKNAILRCSKCGCAKPDQLLTVDKTPAALAVDDRYVFYSDYSDDGSVGRLDKSSLAVEKIPFQAAPFGIAVDDTYVFWTVLGTGASVATSGIWRARKSDLGDRKLLAATQEDPNNIIPYAVAVDGTYVYYTTSPDIDDGNQTAPCSAAHGTVRRIRKDGTQNVTEVLATGQPCPVGLALDNDTVYWLNLGAGTAFDGSVWSVAKNAANADAGQLLIKGLGRPTSLAAHGGRLFWAAPGGQSIQTCKPSGCTDNVQPISSLEANPSGVAVDPSGVYWVDLGTAAGLFNDGALRRAPSPP